MDPRGPSHFLSFSTLANPPQPVLCWDTRRHHNASSWLPNVPNIAAPAVVNNGHIAVNIFSGFVSRTSQAAASFFVSLPAETAPAFFLTSSVIALLSSHSTSAQPVQEGF
ncbi:hypothetical protein CVT26_001795 [Gymnopilus dilepis]|uniref:Uncharacterized protein n=1 Tax=Gymnopilus dilepis TaxID=231916 RepID=A0A409VTG8_9AGAR|nr:hypothetical protein CVT26_001795 [Gymnopilus dilepis]